jgi:Mg-chelatase subunit ChlD
VVFLLDVSDSMPPEATSAALNYLQSALEAIGPDDQAAIVLFGADALVERPMLAGSDLGVLTSVPISNQTDLAEAIRLGLAVFPSGAARRMVILSDGTQTSGDAIDAAEFAAASGVQIIVVPFVHQPDVEALISAVDAPTHLRAGEQFDLNVSVEASSPVPVDLRVLAGGEVLYQGAHDLRRGIQTLSLPLFAGEPGFVAYQVHISPSLDAFYQNNRLDAFSQVVGPPRILMVAPQPGETLPGGQTRPDEHSALQRVLETAGFSLDLVTPTVLPANLPALAQYNTIILVDVPARTLSIRQMTALQTYVRDLGGGLVAVGGPTSYGVGGYYGTPLEAALPVDMEIKDEQRRPSLAIVFVIDHSGSMADASGGVQKLELAKEAAARSVELLFPSDSVGVVTFDDVASWAVPMTDLSNPGAVTSAIGSIQSGGGTDILAGIQAVAETLPADPAKAKHVILLTDGGADPTGIPELVQELYTQHGITLSTVGIGHDAAPFLADLAELGAGRYHFTTDAGSIPSIFTEETILATRAYIVEEPFYPTLVSSSPILAGVESIPPLYGYVAASPKDLAQVVLKSDKDDPILTSWQYGLGRSVAFTSDATGRWGGEWVVWEGFATFWTQAVRYVLNESMSVALELDVSLEGDLARLILDARSRTGTFLNSYQIDVNVVAQDGETQAVTLHQVAPGRYEGMFSPAEQGVYLMHLTGEPDHDASGERFSETTGWTLSYSPEYRHIESDPDLLLRIAALTNGGTTSGDPAEVFIHNLESVRATRPVWPWLVALAALWWPFDIAARRLIITRQDITKLRVVIITYIKKLTQPSPKTTINNQPQTRIESLFRAKDRAKSTIAPKQPQIPKTPEPDDKTPPLTQQDTKQESPPMSDESPPPAPPETTKALLKRKKDLRKK